MKMRNIIVSVAGLALTAGCTHMNKTEKVGQEAITTKEQNVAAKRGDSLVTNVVFNPGSTTLTPEARAELDRAISEARAMGEIDDVTVAVWADQEYPHAAKKLPKAQVTLAERRGKAIESYLGKELNVSSYRVGVHNMAQQPNFLQDFFQTADADLKEQLSQQGVAPASEGMDLSGHASTALLFIKLKH